MTRQEEEAITEEEHNYQQIPLNRIRADIDNPRKNKNAGDGTLGDLSELKASIESQGLQVPLIVERIGQDLYRIVDGERRLTVLKSLTKDPSSVRVSCDIRPTLSDYDRRKLRIELDSTHRNWSFPVKIATIVEHYKEWLKIFTGKLKSNSVTPGVTAFAKEISVNQSTLTKYLVIGQSNAGWSAIMNGRGILEAYEIAKIENESAGDITSKQESLNTLGKYARATTNPEYVFEEIEQQGSIEDGDDQSVAYSRADYKATEDAAIEAGRVRKEVKISKIDPDKASRLACENITKRLDKFGLYYTSIIDQIKHLENASHQERVHKALDRHMRVTQKLITILARKVSTGSID